MSEHEHESKETEEEQAEPKMEDLEVPDEESDEVKGGANRWGKPESPQPHL
ncbi:MAG TPA: hypothetical protein VK488_05345 [Gaiellaceae bacterium]|nr:hypothetical protein [Gaiellaceae bacterium]